MRFVALFILVFLRSVLHGQLAPRSAQKVHTATRLHDKVSIDIDADLSDLAWESAAVASGFKQFEPIPGDPASFDSEVKVLYDNEFLYVGALLHDPEPDKILRQLSVRDQRDNTAWFGVTIDPYQQTQLGFAFIVSAAGVQQDLLVTSEDDDETWNAVWESAVRITDDGWVVELKIPYSAIRFPDVPVQEWGIQFAREIRRFRERTFWNPVLPTVNGFLTQFGKLQGIKDIKPPVRLQLTPFAIGYYDRAKQVGSDAVGEAYYSGGMDLKYGINDAFTLDMTLIPDFGQVRSDNKVLNLSPFEVFFEEQRQFFTEGVELFEKADLFYSRRIGGAPINRSALFAAMDSTDVVIDDPLTTRLLNASKVSGRTSTGLGIGVLNAISGPTKATIESSTGEVRQVETNPLTNYNVVVLDQNLRANSSITLTNTNVWRSGSTYDANVTSLDWDLKDRRQRYGIFGNYALSQKYGPSTELGAQYNLGVAKVSGNVTAEAGYYVETDTYDRNDLGFLQANNEQVFFGEVNYDNYQPKNSDLYQRWRLYLSAGYEKLYAPNVYTSAGLNFGGFWLQQSRDGYGFDVDIQPSRGYDYFEPRVLDFSRRVARHPSARINTFISTDYRKVLALDARIRHRAYFGNDRDETQVRLAPRIRFSDRLFTVLSTTYTNRNREPGFVGVVESPEIGLEPLIGERKRDIVESILSVDYIFSPLISLDGRLRHYWDRVRYENFGLLQEDGFIPENGPQGLEQRYDRNFNIFNVDLFFTWRFAPGSDLIAVWKNSITKINDAYERNYLQNLTGLGEGDQFDSFSIRVIYFLDYDAVRRRL